VTPPLVSLKNLAVRRGNRVVLSGLTADIPRGEVSALVGLNGSGKSTLLRTLLGEFPYSGEILFRCGHDHSRPRPEYVGYVPQRLSIDSRLPLTVRDFLGLALNLRPIFLGFRKGLEARMRAMLDTVGAGGLLDVPVEGLSGGQLQRILLALALEPQPELLLLDEPAAGIDFKDVEDFYTLIGSINQKMKVTVVLVSHEITALNRFAHHVLCLNRGSIVAQGAPAEVLGPERIVQIFGPTASQRLAFADNRSQASNS
jgi:zinc transport system ATP-binding protein